MHAYTCTRAVTCFRVIHSSGAHPSDATRRRAKGQRRLSRDERRERPESFLCLTLQEAGLPLLLISPLVPLVPLCSYQRRILPCSTCLSRVQDGRRSGAEWTTSGVGRGPPGVVSSANAERSEAVQCGVREKGLWRKRKGRSFAERAP